MWISYEVKSGIFLFACHTGIQGMEVKQRSLLTSPVVSLKFRPIQSPKQELPLVGWVNSRTGLEAPEK
jgi:hypothetical protein